MVPCRFEKKMLYLAIRIYKSSILSVTIFAKNNKLFWKYFICTVYEVGMKPSLYIKPVVLDFRGNPKTCAIKFLQDLCRRQTGESTSCCWNKKWPVGSKLYNNLYWNHIRHFSHVVLKILSKTALVSISTARTLLHFSMHFGVSLVFTRHE